MPPKLSEAAIDGKLVALRDYVRCHREELACRGSSCMKDVFAAKRNAEESRFYLFLYKYEAHFTEAQRRHVRETLAQHRESSGGAQCAAKAEQPHGFVASSSATNPFPKQMCVQDGVKGYGQGPPSFEAGGQFVPWPPEALENAAQAVEQAHDAEAEPGDAALTTSEVPQMRRNSDAEQPAAGAEAVMKSVRDSSSSARGGFGQPLAKKARVAIEGSSSGGSQPAAAEGVLDIMADAAKTVTDRGTATGRVIMDQLSAADNKRRVRLLGKTYGFAASLRKKLKSSSSRDVVEARSACSCWCTIPWGTAG